MAYTWREEKKRYKEKKKFKRRLSLSSLASFDTPCSISKMDSTNLFLAPTVSIKASFELNKVQGKSKVFCARKKKLKCN